MDEYESQRCSARLPLPVGKNVNGNRIVPNSSAQVVVNAHAAQTEDSQGSHWQRLELFRQAIKEIDLSGLQRILRTDDLEAVGVYQLLEQLRPMSQVVCGSADICTNRLMYEGLLVGYGTRRQEGLDRGAYAFDDGAKIA